MFQVYIFQTHVSMRTYFATLGLTISSQRTSSWIWKPHRGGFSQVKLGVCGLKVQTVDGRNGLSHHNHIIPLFIMFYDYQELPYLVQDFATITVARVWAIEDVMGCNQPIWEYNGIYSWIYWYIIIHRRIRKWYLEIGYSQKCPVLCKTWSINEWMEEVLPPIL